VNVKKILLTLLTITALLALVAGVNTVFYQYITTSSQSLENDAVTVNLASHQSTLVQQIAKTLYQLEDQHKRNRSTASLLAELKKSSETIEQTLTGLSQGGTVTALDGSVFTLSKAPTANTARLVEQARRIWDPYAKEINKLLQIGDDATERDIGRLLRSARGKTNPLTAITTKTSVELEVWAKTKADGQQNIIIYTAVAIVNVLMIVIFLTYITIRRGKELSKTAANLAESKNQTDLILNTIDEGLILIDQDFAIGPVQSKETSLLLRTDQIDGKSLLDILKPQIPDAQFKTAREYINLMFKKRVKEKLIRELNPLKEVELNFHNHDGTFDTLYYSFNFNRIVENGEVVQLLTTISDITKSVLLAKQLKQFEADAAEQVNLVFNIIHVAPRELDGFINRMKGSLDEINEALKKDRGVGSHQETLDEIFRITHLIKGEAGVLGLDLFESKFHQFETVIVDLKQLNNLTGNDFLRLAVTLEGLFDTVDEVKLLIARLTAIQDQFDSDETILPTPSATTVDPIREAVERIGKRISDRQNKPIVFNWESFNPADIPDRQRDKLKNIVIQLVRNAITHGVETKDQREKIGKPPVATITIKTSLDSKEKLHLVVQDDGQGLQIEKIKERAMISGKWDSEDIKNWTDQKAVSALFTSGFSTASKIDEDAGRGIGMNLIKAEVSNINGKIKISSAKNRYCRFKVIAPAA